MDITPIYRENMKNGRHYFAMSTRIWNLDEDDLAWRLVG